MLFVPPSIPPILAQTEIKSDSYFKTYTEDDNRFSIEYPDDWVSIGGHPDALAGFADQYNWTTSFQVFWNEDNTRDSSSDSKILQGIETDEHDLCKDYTFAEDNRKCSDFMAAESYVMYTDDNEKVYFVSMTYALEWKDVAGKIDGKKYPATSVRTIIFDGDGSWEMPVEAHGSDTYVKYADEILYMIKSFSSDPTPVQAPSPTPDVITSDSSFKKYTFDDDMFSIEYPLNWVLGGGHPDALEAFGDKRDEKTMFQVFLNEDDPKNNRSDSKILGGMEWNEWALCHGSTFEVGNRECTDFKAVESYVTYTNDNEKVYFLSMTYTLEWSSSFSSVKSHQEYPTVRTVGTVFDGNQSWVLATESLYTDNRYSDEILYMIKSFSLDPNAQQQVQPTPKSVTSIPDWVKVNARWWSSDQIPDSVFLQGIQFLIKQGIMVIPPTETSGSSGSQEVPAWIKNNAEWWAEGQIDDNTFVSGIQYLIKVGIIVVT
jgi:hypothetical protein